MHIKYTMVTKAEHQPPRSHCKRKRHKITYPNVHRIHPRIPRDSILPFAWKNWLAPVQPCFSPWSLGGDTRKCLKQTAQAEIWKPMSVHFAFNFWRKLLFLTLPPVSSQDAGRGLAAPLDWLLIAQLEGQRYHAPHGFTNPRVQLLVGQNWLDWIYCFIQSSSSFY